MRKYLRVIAPVVKELCLFPDVLARRRTIIRYYIFNSEFLHRNLTDGSAYESVANIADVECKKNKDRAKYYMEMKRLVEIEMQMSGDM